MDAMNDRRGQILDAAARVMGERGYRATSVDDVIGAAGLAGKSHFYHYFGSKQELGYAVLEHQFARFADRGLAILREPMIDPLDRLHLFIDSLVALQVADGGRSGSPFGRLAAELANGDEGFRERLAAVFARWADAVRLLLDELAGALVPGTDTRRMSRFVVATLEGGLMLARVSRDVGMLTGIAADLKRYVALHLRVAAEGRASTEAGGGEGGSVAVAGGARG
jgi:TetR/AcrR family transcriptional regulator, transcriptional repressor for nem operon